jgi:hypothetical protein
LFIAIIGIIKRRFLIKKSMIREFRYISNIFVSFHSQTGIKEDSLWGDVVMVYTVPL